MKVEITFDLSGEHEEYEDDATHILNEIIRTIQTCRIYRLEALRLFDKGHKPVGRAVFGVTK